MKPIFLSLLLFVVPAAMAQHPSEIESLTAREQYFEALVAFEKLPNRRATPAAVVAAARSAWALGLSERAAKEFDKALRQDNLTPVQRARLLLSRGVLEYQEGRYQIAIMFADKAINLLPEPSPLRAEIALLWAESLSAQKSHGLAEEKYLQALREVAPEDRPEVAYQTAECHRQLGKYEDARRQFEMVPLRHERAPHAIRGLAQIALEMKRYPQAAFWLTKGREEFPEHFIDSWVDYALVVTATNMRDGNRVRTLQAEAIKKYAPSDPWVVLLSSTAEAYLWSETKQGGA